MRFAVFELASMPHGELGRAGIEAPVAERVEANTSALDRLGLRVYCPSTGSGREMFRSPSLSRGMSIPEQWQILQPPISSGCETENQ